LRRKKSKEYEFKASAICFILLVLFILISLLINNVQAAEVITYKNYTVKQGEVLEDIAMRYYADTYLPKAKCEIKKLNNMIESDIYEGQVILVKVEVK